MKYTAKPRLINRILTVFLSILMGAIACTPSTKNDGTDASGANTAFSPDAAPPSGGQPIDLAKAKYAITTANYQDDPRIGMPSFDIFLHITGAADSLLIARDYAASIFDQASMDSYAKLIPAEAVFLINSYYAGAGYYYYGIPDQNTLKVYRLFQEEGNPDQPEVNQAPPAPQLMKTAKIFSDHIEVAQFALEENK
jgi:hypothetical protein